MQKNSEIRQKLVMPLQNCWGLLSNTHDGVYQKLTEEQREKLAQAETHLLEVLKLVDAAFPSK